MINLNYNEVLKLINDGLSQRSISKELNVSRTTIVRFMKSNNLKTLLILTEKQKKPNYVDIDKSELEKLINDNLKGVEIAEYLNISTAILYKKLKKFDLKIKNVLKSPLCNTCGDSDILNFGKSMRNYCIECYKIKSNEKQKQKKQRMVNYKGGKCIHCGYKKNLNSLEFHHLNPKYKDSDFTRLKNWSEEKQNKELDKCVLLCSNCHREEHDRLKFENQKKIFEDRKLKNQEEKD